MKCEEIQINISALLDGELTPAEKAELEAHLSTCAACRKVHSAVKRASVSIKQLETVPAPRGFHFKVEGAIKSNKAGFREPETKIIPMSGGFYRALFAGAAAASIVFALGIAVFLNMEKKDTPVTPELTRSGKTHTEQPLTPKEPESKKLALKGKEEAEELKSADKDKSIADFKSEEPLSKMDKGLYTEKSKDAACEKSFGKAMPDRTVTCDKPRKEIDKANFPEETKTADGFADEAEGYAEGKNDAADDGIGACGDVTVSEFAESSLLNEISEEDLRFLERNKYEVVVKSKDISMSSKHLLALLDDLRGRDVSAQTARADGKNVSVINISALLTPENLAELRKKFQHDKIARMNIEKLCAQSEPETGADRERLAVKQMPLQVRAGQTAKGIVVTSDAKEANKCETDKEPDNAEYLVTITIIRKK